MSFPLPVGEKKKRETGKHSLFTCSLIREMGRCCLFTYSVHVIREMGRCCFITWACSVIREMGRCRLFTYSVIREMGRCSLFAFLIVSKFWRPGIQGKIFHFFPVQKRETKKSPTKTQTSNLFFVIEKSYSFFFYSKL